MVHSNPSIFGIISHILGMRCGFKNICWFCFKNYIMTHSNLFIMHYDHQCYVFIPLYRGDQPYHYLVHHILEKGIFAYPRYIVVPDIKFIVPSI